MEPTVSQHVVLHHVENCRDLGGMRTSNGRVIRLHMLLRSAELHHATVEDLATLRDMGLQTVVDLRTRQERDAKRDRLLVSWDLEQLPVFDEHSALPMQMRGIIEHPGTFIRDLYAIMITSPAAVAAWKSLFAILLKQPTALLWHCTQGKDRTGVAAALIETALGVDEESIRADYLETNKFMPQEVPAELLRMQRYLSPIAKVDVDQFLTATPDNFDTMMRAAEPYDGLLGYLQQEIGLSDDDISRLRECYTVPANEEEDRKSVV